jgi:hypothetical protein
MKKINYFCGLLLLLVIMAGCRKTEFGSIPNPAYIRVFNCLDMTITLDNKDAPQPFLAMLIDPVMDENNIPVSAAVTGDHLNTRAEWARPYPDAGNTNVYQTEYPGTAKVMAAPILNGYDLSSWAQVPSGKHRFLFVSRPMNTTPFFNLDKSLRGYVLLDTTVELTTGEVYTMHVLEKNFTSRKNILYVRNETFIKQPLSDSLVYVNFYNLSSEEYFQKGPDVRSGGVPAYKLVDTSTVFLSLRRPVNVDYSEDIQGYSRIPMGFMARSHEPKVAPYHSFPLFADTSSNRIYPGNTAQFFEFVKPGYVLGPGSTGGAYGLPLGYYLGLRVGPYGRTNGNDLSVGIMADIRSGMIITERSGPYNPRYFATVNTIEYINARTYLTTIQRRFDPPIY